MGWVSEHVFLILVIVIYIFHVLWFSEFKQKLNMSTFAVYLLSLLAVVAGVVGSRGLALIEMGTLSGMRIYGIIFLIPILTYTIAKVSKRNIADAFDMVTISLSFSCICGRINCLIKGCCTGTVLLGTQVISLPIRELEIALYIVLLIVLGRNMDRKPWNGKAYPIFLMVYGLFRFVIEWFREPVIPVGFLDIAHIWSIVAILIGTFIYIKILKKEGKETEKKEGKKQ